MCTSTTSAATAPEAAVAELPPLDLRLRRRPWGGLGIRHRLLVVPSVICAARTAELIAEGERDAIAVEHQHGCSQLGGDARLTEHVLKGLATNPNVAGAVVVGLGCETVQGILLHRAVVDRGQRAEFVGIQQSGGTQAAVRAGREALRRLRGLASADPEVRAAWEALTIGVEGGWLALPPTQARTFAQVIQRLVEGGATVIQAVPQESRWPSTTADAGETSGDETPLEAVIHALPVRPHGELPYGGPLTGRGLWLMRAPRARAAQKTGLVAAGAHLVLSPLVSGLPVGSPVAPVVHVGVAPSGRSWGGDVEVILDEDPGPRAAEAILRALGEACGGETVTEMLGTTELAIHRVAPTM